MNRILPLILLAANCIPVSAFVARDVEIVNPYDSIILNGTITLPDSPPKALVVMATGSGIQDRDETVFGFKPFKMIAESLAEAGYGVLRMDDRGYGLDPSAPIVTQSTIEDFIGDISAGVDYFQKEYPSTPIGVLGHSEGGTIAVKIASRQDPPCSFIITLAAPAWRGDSIVMSQSRAIATALTGKWEGEKLERRLLDIVMSPTPAIFKRMSLYNETVSVLGSTLKIPEVQKSFSSQLEIMLSPYYRDMLLYDPARDISAVSIPWLALNGDKDTQVLPANLKTIKELNPSANTILLPSHNHLFQNCDTGLPQEYSLLKEDISNETIAAIKLWLDSKFK